MATDDDLPKEPAAAGAAVRRLASVSEAQIRQLADLLIDCVEGGAAE